MWDGAAPDIMSADYRMSVGKHSQASGLSHADSHPRSGRLSVGKPTYRLIKSGYMVVAASFGILTVSQLLNSTICSTRRVEIRPLIVKSGLSERRWRAGKRLWTA